MHVFHTATSPVFYTGIKLREKYPRKFKKKKKKKLNGKTKKY